MYNDGFEFGSHVKKKVCTNLFQFKADIGLVGPLSAPGILPYQECFQNVKSQMLLELDAEWPSLSITNDYILSHWQGGSDIFYILCDENDGSFIGCVAVDRHNFYPFITNLYVTPLKRNKGYGSLLLNHGIAFTKSMGFKDARLWCRESLLKWYQKMNWLSDTTQKKDDEIIYLMIKPI